MKGFDILKVKSAVKTHNKFDLSRTHLTTMDFGEIVPLMVEETVPGDKFSVNAEYFSRMAPLAKPTYGKFDFRTVAAFVPYHQIAWDSDAWLAGKTSWEGQTPHHRYITVETLHYFVNGYCGTSLGATSANCDYTFVAANGTIQYVILTEKGRYWVKVLNALGYTLPQGVDLQSASTWTTSVKNTKLSAYPLLAFFKVYNDYMSQSQRYNTSSLSNLLQCIKYGKAVAGFTPSSGQIVETALNVMFSNLFLNYDNDYFTGAWQNPNAALAGQDSVLTAEVPAGNQISGDYAIHNLNDTQLHVTTNAGLSFTLGQRALDFLKDFDDWVRRNNYSGSRAVQQIYSRFGIKTDDYRSHYANIISTDKLPIQVGDITSMADTTDAKLGEYAGKGIMNGSKAFDISVSDYGVIFVLGYFTVVPMNPYGYDRRVLRNQPLDYYNPEFDGIGADAISVGEYFVNPTSTSSAVTDNAVFGYTERYNAYRYGRDMITGEFRDFKGEMNVWHTGRDMTDIRDAGNLVAQSTSVNTLPQTGSEYNRIFSITDDSVNHFYLTARFNVSAVRPMLNLNQVTNLGEGDTVVPRNGNVIS